MNSARYSSKGAFTLVRFGQGVIVFFWGPMARMRHLDRVMRGGHGDPSSKLKATQSSPSLPVSSYVFRSKKKIPPLFFLDSSSPLTYLDHLKPIKRCDELLNALGASVQTRTTMNSP